ncbi:hypothetical protein HA402_011974 [Bradysia odoriphaga]|nr:hypothetical protein HA402_011974 [Bradysia odoriphaga]
MTKFFAVIVLLFGLLKSSSCSLNVQCYSNDVHRRILFTGPHVPGKSCFIFDWPSSSERQESYDFSVDYAQNIDITKIELHGEPGSPSVPLEVKRIPNEIFTVFPELTRFYAHIALTFLDYKDFRNAMNLTDICIYSGNIKTLSSTSFSPVSQPATQSINEDHTPVFPLHKLYALRLYNNGIDEIEDKAFFGLTRLLTLRIERNSLTAIRRHTFAGLPSLENLSLRGNKIETIEDGSFELPALLTLMLEKNKLKRLSENVFSQLSPNLEGIALGYNDLVHVGRSLYALSKVKVIRLERNRGNGIDDLDTKILDKMSSLYFVTLPNDEMLTYRNVSPTINFSFNDTSGLIG